MLRTNENQDDGVREILSGYGTLWKASTYIICIVTVELYVGEDDNPACDVNASSLQAEHNRQG